MNLYLVTYVTNRSPGRAAECYVLAFGPTEAQKLVEGPRVYSWEADVTDCDYVNSITLLATDKPPGARKMPLLR